MSGNFGPLGLLAAMAKIKSGVKARQVSTHTHERVPLSAYKQYKDVGHWDFKKIEAGASWEFPLMEGPGWVAAIWITVAGRLIEALFRFRVPAPSDTSSETGSPPTANSTALIAGWKAWPSITRKRRNG